MGIINDLRTAASGAAIRQALKGPAKAPAIITPPRARIGKKGPPVLEVIPSPNAAVTLMAYEALNPEPQRWFRIMERADAGDTGSMIDMFCDARLRDAHLDGVAKKRAQSMMGRPIIFRPPDGFESDEYALEIARRVRRVLLSESRGFRSMLTHLMQGAVDGYSVAKIRWASNADGWFVPHLEWVHANRFAFCRDDLRFGFYTSAYRSAWNVAPLDEYPDCFVVHMPIGGCSDYPWRRGAMRSSIIPSFIKRNGLRFWMTLAERFGMPQPFARLPAGEDNDAEDSESIAEKTKEALSNLGRLWSMVVSAGVEIDSIPGAGQVDAKVHSELIQWADTAQSVGILGQNLTTVVQGGSFAAAEAHRWVASDLHLADATELQETITQQLVEPIVRYNWPGSPIPVCEISTAPKQVFQVEDVREGIASADERRRTLGHEAQPNSKGAEYRTPPGVQVPVQSSTPS